jgi:adenine deaminase
MPLIDRENLLRVARGDAPADLLLRNARIVNVFSTQIDSGDIAIADGHIAGVGSGYTAKQTIDLKGSYVAPGLIDAHVHIESSLCLPAQFAAAVVSRGVTTVVTDPHEIANVAGLDGIRFMVESSRGLPIDVITMAPSCVPATDLATSGASLDADALRSLLTDGSVHGLAEVMNFPGVIQHDPQVITKLRAFAGRPIDGHAPAVSGKALNAYAASGIGSDHECVSVEEAREKLARGLYILIREATNARNLNALLPLITPQNSRRICFCSDDRQPADLLDHGSIDYIVQRVISAGIAPVVAFQMATLNPCEWFGLHDRGAIAPGRAADLMIFDDLNHPIAREVYKSGELVWQAGRLPPGRFEGPTVLPTAVSARCNILPDTIDLRIRAKSNRIRVIGSLVNQLVTEHFVMDALVKEGFAFADPSRDILKMAVIERHRGTGKVGLGFIKGFGLATGAIAGTVAHDHHNLVVIGSDDVSMMTAIRAVVELGGGLVTAANQQVLASLPLPVAGLMSDQPIERVRASYDNLRAEARQLGSPLHDPFMAMSFMALEVIPKLKLTDRGLVDVEKFGFVDLFV